MLQRWYRVEKQGAVPAQVEKALKLCTVQSTIRNYSNDSLEPPFNIYKEDETAWYWPTFTGIEIFGMVAADRDFRDRGDPLPSNVKFVGKLQESRFQPQAVKACVAQLKEVGGAILHKACGLGKTVDALAIAAEMGVRFGVLVDKSFLMNQWIERIKEYLPNCKVGICRGQHVDRDCDAIIVMAKTQSMYAYEFNGVGLWIVDECHKFCAQTVSKCLPSVASRYMLALSATPERRDGLHTILDAWFNGIAFSAQRDHESVQVYHITYSKEPKVKMLKSGKPNIAAMINLVCADPERNELIAWHLCEQLQEGRRILLLSDRREHLTMLEEAVRIQWNKSAVVRIAQASVYEWVVPDLADLGLHDQPVIDYYIGGRKAEELAIAERADLILATFQMAKEALDLKPPPDTLIIASPKADLVQAIGRMRLESVEKQARILDFVDPFSVFYGLAKKRESLYEERAYEITDWNDRVRLGVREPEVIDDSYPF